MNNIHLFTIGFTKKSAETFFTTLQNAGVRRVVDVRLNNNSQLAGFSKRDDLAYFLRSIGGIEYVHLLDLAPTQEMFDRYKKGAAGWDAYEREFNDLIKKRRIEDSVAQELLHEACLVCSEDRPEHCHRRLVAEHLQRSWHDVTIVHLT